MYCVYSAEKIKDTLGLTHGGMVMVELMAGGDYSDGINGMGIQNAAALARAGFGDTLERAYTEKKGADLNDFLVTWSDNVIDEMCTNSKGFLPLSQPAMAKLIQTSNFPD